MNWAIPRAPAGDTARGLKPDSAISCAASSAAETFQRAAECSSGSWKRPGTNEGRLNDGAPAESAPPWAGAAPVRSPAVEQGGGPAAYPKCHGSQAYRF